MTRNAENDGWHWCPQRPEKVRPYACGTTLVTVSEVEWESAQGFETQISDLEDDLANLSAHTTRLVSRLRKLIAQAETRAVMSVGVSELRSLLPEEE